MQRNIGHDPGSAMHELSLAGEIVRMVEASAVRDKFRQVSTLRLEAGALAGVEVAALRFALEAIASGTCLEGATIVIDEPIDGKALRVLDLIVVDE
jgi:hydrogenase nickel incorporation protein HypA/HybF